MPPRRKGDIPALGGCRLSGAIERRVAHRQVPCPARKAAYRLVVVGIGDIQAGMVSAAAVRRPPEDVKARLESYQITLGARIGCSAPSGVQLRPEQSPLGAVHIGPRFHQATQVFLVADPLMQRPQC